jgi:hypothetical protein
LQKTLIYRLVLKIFSKLPGGVGYSEKPAAMEGIAPRAARGGYGAGAPMSNANAALRGAHSLPNRGHKRERPDPARQLWQKCAEAGKIDFAHIGAANINQR